MNGHISNLRSKIKEKCSNVTIFDFKDFDDCSTSFINITELDKELDEAKPSKNLYIIISTYRYLFVRKVCKNHNELVDCYKNRAMFFDQCFTNEEIKIKNTFDRVIKKLADFVCENDGDQIDCKFSFIYTVGFTSGSLILFIFSIFIAEWARVYKKS